MISRTRQVGRKGRKGLIVTTEDYEPEPPAISFEYPVAPPPKSTSLDLWPVGVDTVAKKKLLCKKISDNISASLHLTRDPASVIEVLNGMNGASGLHIHMRRAVFAHMYIINLMYSPRPTRYFARIFDRYSPLSLNKLILKKGNEPGMSPVFDCFTHPGRLLMYATWLETRVFPDAVKLSYDKFMDSSVKQTSRDSKNVSVVISAVLFHIGSTL